MIRTFETQIERWALPRMRLWPAMLIAGILALLACQREAVIQNDSANTSTSNDALEANPQTADAHRKVDESTVSNQILGQMAEDSQQQPSPEPLQNNEVVVVPPTESNRDTSAGAAVVAYANTQMGKRVGNGQCTELAIYALQAAGKGSPSFAGMSYAWGDHVVQLTPNSTPQDFDKIKPGDVLQLEGVSASGLQAQHHTQVVIANRGNGIITVAEQNPMPVTQNDWNFGSMQSGTVDVWSPSSARN